MIQFAQPEDWTNIKTLCQEVLPSFPCQESWNLTPFERCLIVQEEGMLKGVLFYQILYERAEIDYIAVSKAHQKLGIGSKLMAYFLEDCQNHHVTDLSLEVSEHNQTAISFYQKFGFQVVAKRSHYYEDGDALLMVKKVNL